MVCCKAISFSCIFSIFLWASAPSFGQTPQDAISDVNEYIHRVQESLETASTAISQHHAMGDSVSATVSTQPSTSNCDTPLGRLAVSSFLATTNNTAAANFVLCSFFVDDTGSIGWVDLAVTNWWGRELSVEMFNVSYSSHSDENRSGVLSYVLGSAATMSLRALTETAIDLSPRPLTQRERSTSASQTVLPNEVSVASLYIGYSLNGRENACVLVDLYNETSYSGQYLFVGDEDVRDCHLAFDRRLYTPERYEVYGELARDLMLLFGARLTSGGELPTLSEAQMLSAMRDYSSSEKADGYFDLYDGDAYLEEIDNYLNHLRFSSEAMLRVRQPQNFSNGEPSWSFSQAECQTELGEFSFDLGRRAVGFARNVPAGAFECRTGTYGTPGTNSFGAYSGVTMRNIDQSVVDVLSIRLDSSVNRGTVTKFLTTDAHVPMILLLKELGAPSVERYQNEIHDLYLQIGNLDEAKDHQCVVVGLIGVSGDAMVEYNFVGANSEDFCLSVFPNRYAETRQLNVSGEQEHNMILLAAARLSQGLSLWGMDGYARNIFARQADQLADNSTQDDNTTQSFLPRLFDGFGIFEPDPEGPSDEEIVTALYEIPEYRALFRITLKDTNRYCEDTRNCTVEARYSFDLVPRTQDAFVDAYVSALYASGVPELETRMLRLSVQTALMFSEYPANVMAIIPGIGVDHTDLMTFVLGDEGWIYIPAEPTNSSSSSQSYDNPLQGFVREHSNF